MVYETNGIVCFIKCQTVSDILKLILKIHDSVNYANNKSHCEAVYMLVTKALLLNGIHGLSAILFSVLWLVAHIADGLDSNKRLGVYLTNIIHQ